MADTIQDNQGNYNTINSQTLNPQPQMGLPPSNGDTTDYNSIIEGLLKGLPGLNTQLDAAGKSQTNLLSRLALGENADLGKEQYSQDQLALNGVKDYQSNLDDYNSQFSDLTAQLKGLSRASQAVPLQVQQNNLGTGATDAGVAPQEAGALRENAIKALTLASHADVLGAQITNTENRLQRAKDNAQQAVDLKYKPIEAQNAFLQNMLDLNQKYIIDPAEKKKTEATNAALQERSRLLEQQKQDEKDNTDLIINANSQRAPASVISKANQLIAKGAKPADVANALGVYAGDYIGNQAKVASILASQSSTRKNDLDYQISSTQFKQSQAPALGQNADGTIVKGAGATTYDRNTNTVENLMLSKNKLIPDGTKTLVGNGLGVLNTIQQFVAANPDGKFAGFYPVGNGLVPDALKSDARTKNEGLAAAINLPLQRWASGASLTDAQTKLVMDMVPKPTDTDARVREKLNTLANMMTGQISADLSSSGVKYRPENIDYFDTGIGNKVKNAIGAGYGSSEVIQQLSSDPTYSPKIQSARKAGYTDDQIITYLQSQ